MFFSRFWFKVETCLGLKVILVMICSGNNLIALVKALFLIQSNFLCKVIIYIVESHGNLGQNNL